jgi:CubicO group peptidase (beta-lactamase class C family)
VVARKAMADERVPGLAVAVIQDGKVVDVRAYGLRDVAGQAPLRPDTVMYGASLTKAAFAYMVMTLVDEGRFDLDKPFAEYLPKPLPDYDKYRDLAADPRWRRLTGRMVLEHATGFPNFRFLNADGKLDFKFDPGTRYAYSGEGINLLQFVLEKGLGLDVGREMQRRVFDRFAMTRTSMTWRDDFAGNLATGYDQDGKAEPHHKRESVRAAGSMDTTVADYGRFLAGLSRGEGLSAKARAEMLKPQLAITSAYQFPTLDPTPGTYDKRIGLAAGLGVITFKGPQGRVFYKGGHDDFTDNLAICVEARRRCVLMMSNSVRGEEAFAPIAREVLGETGFPWAWEYNPLPASAR